MCHMTYFREFLDRYRQGDVVAAALAKSIAAVDPGLQLSFVFSQEDAAAVAADKITPEMIPRGLSITVTSASIGLIHPSAVAARLRQIAAELDDAVLRSIDAESKARVAAAAVAPSPVPAPAAAAPAELPPQ